MKSLLVVVLLASGVSAQARSINPFLNLNCRAASPSHGPIKGHEIIVKANILQGTAKVTVLPVCLACMIVPKVYEVSFKRSGTVDTYKSADGDFQMKMFLESVAPRTGAYPAQVKSSYINGGKLTPAVCEVDSGIRY